MILSFLWFNIGLEVVTLWASHDGSSFVLVWDDRYVFTLNFRILALVLIGVSFGVRSRVFYRLNPGFGKFTSLSLMAIVLHRSIPLVGAIGWPLIFTDHFSNSNTPSSDPNHCLRILRCDRHISMPEISLIFLRANSSHHLILKTHITDSFPEFGFRRLSIIFLLNRGFIDFSILCVSTPYEPHVLLKFPSKWHFWHHICYFSTSSLVNDFNPEVKECGLGIIFRILR
jgi:hypothetical protein